MSRQQQPLAKFFCEFCDYEVPIDARFCPRCGHFFASVRCPVCGKTGDQSIFKHGCPQCGYGNKPTRLSPQPQEPVKGKRTFSLPRFKGNLNIPSVEKKKVTTGALPIWIYIVVLALVLGIILLAESML